MGLCSLQEGTLMLEEVKSQAEPLTELVSSIPANFRVTMTTLNNV